MRRVLPWVPLIVLALFGLAFLSGLARPKDDAVRSRLIGRDMPDFTLPPAAPGVEGLAKADLATGRPHLVNIFASWCIPCAIEAPQLKALADAGVPVVGIAIRDRPEDLARFLRRNGNPFARIGGDTASAVQIALGSSGVPESFVVDGSGRIRLQHIGEIRPEEVAAIKAAVEAAR